MRLHILIRGGGKLGATQYYEGVAGNTCLWLLDPSVEYVVDPQDLTTASAFSGEAYTTWAFVSQAEYEKWVVKSIKYEAAKALNDYITAAEEQYEGIDLSESKAVYANTLSSLSELEEALENAKEIVTRFRFSNLQENDDCTELLVNASFADGFNGWNYRYGTVGGLKAFPTVECWDGIVDCSQTVRGVPTGIYAISVKAFERPGYNGTFDIDAPSKVSLFMNGFQTSVQNILTDALLPDQAEDMENCYITGVEGANGSAEPGEPYYDTSGTRNLDYSTVEGYIPNGMSGASYAFRAGRYEQTCYGLVGDDGVMKIGLTSNEEKCHWVLWADFKLTYMAKNAQALASVLDVMSAPFETYVSENAANMNVLAANSANNLLTSISTAKEAGDGETLWEALVALDAAFPVARANVAAMTAYNVVAAQFNSIQASTVAAVDEEQQAAYRAAAAQMENIDNLTTDEIVELTEVVRAAMQGMDYIVIETAQAGTLGDKVLDIVENFTDVTKLKVVGPINSTDMENIARMTNVTELNLMETTGLTSLGSTFSGNEKLEYIALPGSITNINSYAFSNCTNLLQAELGEGMTFVESYMFSGCYRLQKVVLPTTLKTIDRYAFYNCYSLTDFTLPEGLTTISLCAFYRSNSAGPSVDLGSYYDNDGNYQEIRLDVTSPTEIILPSTVTSIGSSAFYNWSNLVSLTLNEGLVEMGSNAFYGANNLNNVVLPSTLKTIGSDVFPANPMTLTSKALVPPTISSDSYNSPASNPGTLYVSNLVTKAYKQQAGWDQFNIVGIDYVPENIAVDNELTLEVKNGAFEDKKPNVWLKGSDQNTSYYNAQYGALTVNGDETLSMNRFNTVSDPNMFSYSSSGYRNYRSYATLLNNASMRADNVNTSLYVMSDRWYFFSFPYDVKVSEIRDVFGGAQWVIRKYDGEKRAAEDMENTWVNVGEDETLEAYKGYIWQMGQRGSDNWGGFDVPAINNSNKNNIFANGDVEVALAEYQSDYAHNRSWNLIGNPYPCYYDTRAMGFTAPITVWNYYYSRYEAYSPMDDDYVLAPNEAFFVQRPIADQESIVFSKAGRQHNNGANEDEWYDAKGRQTSARANRLVMNLQLSDGENADRTRVVINEAALADYELDKDASKFMTTTNVPQFYTLSKGVRYAINERPLGDGRVNLGMCLANAGTYTLSLQNKTMGDILLEDTETGKIINLNEADYTFTAQPGISDARFILYPGDVDATGLNGIASQAAVTELYTLDGRRVQGTATSGIYLQKNGKKFQKVYVK